MDASSIDWRALSPRGRAILRLVAVPATEGFSYAEIAERLGVSEPRVGDLMRQLRRELTPRNEEA